MLGVVIGDYIYYTPTSQLQDDENDDDVKVCFSIDEGENLLSETGYHKPVCSMKLSDRPSIVPTLLGYHLTIKVKVETDQFKEGLQTLGFLEALQSNPKMREPYFMNIEEPLTTGTFCNCLFKI